MAKIVLCAGHHEGYKGAVNKQFGLNEFDESSKIMHPLVEMLTEAGHRVPTVSSAGLRDKVKFVNSVGADIALDLHFNADYDHLDPDDLNDKRGQGCMVMYCPRGDSFTSVIEHSRRRSQATLMAGEMALFIGNRNLGGRAGWYWGQTSLDAKGHPTVKDYFLRKTNCPAFIPEFGYIDNNGFAQEWLVANRHESLAEALFNGIEAVLREL